MPKNSVIGSTRPRAVPVSAPCTCIRSLGPLGTTWIRLSGELDHSRVPNIAEKLKEAQASSYLVVIDLRELKFIDYAWLGALIAADARARQAKRSLVLIRGSGQVDRMLEESGVLEQLEVVDLQPATVSLFPTIATILRERAALRKRQRVA